MDKVQISLLPAGKEGLPYTWDEVTLEDIVKLGNRKARRGRDYSYVITQSKLLNEMYVM